MVSIVKPPRELVSQMPEAFARGDSISSRFEHFEELSARSRRRLPVVRAEKVNSGQATLTDEAAYAAQSGWLARVLATSRPRRHVDVSSSICFAATASAFVPVDYYSPIPRKMQLPNLRTSVADPQSLPLPDKSVESISCSGIVEKLGLGDRLDPDADLKVFAELARVLAPDGSLLLVCPVGKPRVIFDCRRIYGFGQVLDEFEGLELEEFTLIPDGADSPLVNPDPSLRNQIAHGGGCFWFRRPA